MSTITDRVFIKSFGDFKVFEGEMDDMETVYWSEGPNGWHSGYGDWERAEELARAAYDEQEEETD